MIAHICWIRQSHGNVGAWWKNRSSSRRIPTPLTICIIRNIIKKPVTYFREKLLINIAYASVRSFFRCIRSSNVSRSQMWGNVWSTCLDVTAWQSVTNNTCCNKVLSRFDWLIDLESSRAGRSSEVERSLMVRWVVGSILHGVNPLSYFSFQPVLHDWCNKGRGMCYPVCGMVHIKEPLLLIGKSSLCGGSGFPLSLSEWSLTICLTPYNRR